MPAVEVEHLHVRFGERHAVDDLSFSIERGEVVALLGPNGAGKTTTVETLEGYRLPDEGAVRVLGLDPSRQRRALAAKIGVVLQRGGVYPVMSPERVLSLFASYYDGPRQPADLLALLGLESVARTAFKRLSGGEQQRLLLALALVGRPQVLFLDEPTAGVDPRGRIAVREVIASCRDEGAAVLVTSHELDEIERMADRVVIIDRGRVLASGSPTAVGGGGNEVRFFVEGLLDRQRLGAALSAEVVVERPSWYRIAAESSPALVARLTAWLAENDLVLGEVRVGHERLEDVFLRLVEEREGGS